MDSWLVSLSEMFGLEQERSQPGIPSDGCIPSWNTVVSAKYQVSSSLTL